MNERYQVKEMKQLWSLKNRYEKFLIVEKAATKAFNALGVVPDKDLDLIIKNTYVDLDRILELEEETKHDVVAFTRSLSEQLGSESKWIHYSLTSTDVVDTANGLLFKEADSLILAQYDLLLNEVRRIALENKDTMCIGRTHGIHADITSFGLKFARYYDELVRAKENFLRACQEVEVTKISGAVGNFANVDPRVQEYVAKELGLKSVDISTQVLTRDRFASYFSNLALIGSILEEMATEIRHLSRTEVGEVRELFSQGQKGSSAMPHKKNPVSSENICGLARVLRGYMLTSFENMNLWHERDISHSSAERIIFEDGTSLIHYMLKRMTSILKNLTIDKERMLENINLTNGNIFSQRILNKLVEKGLRREEAYDLVQPLTFKVNSKTNLKDLLLNNQSIKKYLTKEEIEDSFDMDYYLKNVDYIYQRVGLK